MAGSVIFVIGRCGSVLVNMTFLEISALRQKRLESKYLDEHGINRAMYDRNNLVDVVEELADAYNITKLMNDRFGIKCTGLLSMIKTVGDNMVSLACNSRDKFPHDVERVVNIFE